MTPKTIVLISSGQPSLNPRLVKEADALTDAGYKVIVLYAYWNEWGTKLDETLLASRKWKAIRVGGDPLKKKAAYMLSRLMFRLARAIVKETNFKLLPKNLLARSSWHLIKAAKKHKADLYIAHNLGALPAAVEAAQHHNKRCGFDAEDYHRNEISDDPESADVRSRALLEDRYITQTDQLTASSPQIAASYKKIYPSLQPAVVLNVCPKTTTAFTVSKANTPLRLFWFSQTIGPDRGLEDVIDALKQLPTEQFELHLLGHSDKNNSFNKVLGTAVPNIVFHPVMPPDDLPAFAANFDVGLATERRTPYNRDICLTNKLFTYLQSGLAIVASDTQAQKAFLSSEPGAGLIYTKDDGKRLPDILQRLYDDRKLLNSIKQHCWQLGQQKYNWELERTKLLNLVADTLSE